MKIICIANNSLKKYQNSESPVFFLKPDTSILLNNKPFFLPFENSLIRCSVSPVVRIIKVGKNIAEKFANRYYNEITAGIDFTDITKLDECIKNGLPWEAAKAFENSAPIGKFYHKNILNEKPDGFISLFVNGEKSQEFQIKNLTFSFDLIISYVSQYFTLKTGDLIFLGTPEKAMNIQANDQIKILLHENPVLDFSIN